MYKRYYKNFIWDTTYFLQNIKIFLLYIPGAKLVRTKQIRHKKRNGVFANEPISDFNRNGKKLFFF